MYLSFYRDIKIIQNSFKFCVKLSKVCMATKSWWICMSIILLTSCTSSIFVVHSIATTPHKTCWDKSWKCLFFLIILAKTETSAKWMPHFPPPLIQSCLWIAWQLYTLVFTPRQLWTGGGEGAYFCLEETGVERKSLKIDGIVSTVLSGVVDYKAMYTALTVLKISSKPLLLKS